MDETLSLGQEGSKGKKASPILKTESTEIMYSAEGGMYKANTFGMYTPDSASLSVPGDDCGGVMR